MNNPANNGFAKYIIIFLILICNVLLSKEELTQNQIGINLDSIKTDYKKANKVEQELDTLNNNNRIESALWSRAEELLRVKLSLESRDQPVQLLIYNMLAKPVKSKDINASELLSTQEFTFENTTDLPQGHYFCVLIGSGFRDTKKFTISR